MTCRKFKKLLIPWLDGELSPERATELKAFLSQCGQVRQCSECRKLIDDYQSFHRLMNSIPQKEFPAYLHHRIIDEINRREPIFHKRQVRVRWQTVPATLAILLSLYVGSLIGIRTFSTPAQTNETQELYSYNGNFGDHGLATELNLSGGTQ